MVVMMKYSTPCIILICQACEDTINTCLLTVEFLIIPTVDLLRRQSFADWEEERLGLEAGADCGCEHANSSRPQLPAPVAAEWRRPRQGRCLQCTLPSATREILVQHFMKDLKILSLNMNWL